MVKHYLGSSGKFFAFLFLFFLVFSLSAQPSFDEELSVEDVLFILMELFIGSDAFSLEAYPEDEQELYEEELAIDEEDSFFDEEGLLGEDYFYVDDDDFDLDDFVFEAPSLIFEVPEFETRSFDALFPGLSRRQKSIAMSSIGLRHFFVAGESPTLIPAENANIDIFTGILRKNPSHLIEALILLPYNEKELGLLDIYNALGRIERIKNQAVSLNGNDFFIFTESTRLESSRNRRAIPDPPPAYDLPFSETMFLRLREFSIGNLFLRGDVSISLYGITYSMTNFVDIRYFLIPVMRAERYTTIIYLEPVTEGILIYSMTGFYLPGFIADSVNLTPNINRRLQVFIDWITEGLREQEKKEEFIEFDENFEDFN